LAYKEILLDLRNFSESEFVTKYLDVVKELSKQIDKRELLPVSEMEEKAGYNNAIVSILSLINPIYEFETEDDKNFS